jgi:hypothetical protein
MLGLKDVKREHMKKLALVLVVALSITSCGKDKPDVQSTADLRIDTDESIKVTKFQGHDYIIYDVYESGGICHSESCPCKSK